LLPAGISTVHLATGLPYEDYRHQRQPMEKMLRNFQTNVEFHGGPLNGESRAIRFHQVTVFPQAAGAVYASLDAQTLRQVAGSGKLISVVDVGYKTTDVVTFEAGDTFRLRSDLSGTVDQGISDLERRILAAFNERTGRRLDQARAGRLIEEGGMHLGGQFIELRDQISQAKEALTGLIMDKVRLVWRDYADLIWRVYLVGGGCLTGSAPCHEPGGGGPVLQRSGFFSCGPAAGKEQVAARQGSPRRHWFSQVSDRLQPYVV